MCGCQNIKNKQEDFHRCCHGEASNDFPTSFWCFLHTQRNIPTRCKSTGGTESDISWSKSESASLKWNLTLFAQGNNEFSPPQKNTDSWNIAAKGLFVQCLQLLLHKVFRERCLELLATCNKSCANSLQSFLSRFWDQERIINYLAWRNPYITITTLQR